MLLPVNPLRSHRDAVRVRGQLSPAQEVDDGPSQRSSKGDREYISTRELSEVVERVVAASKRDAALHRLLIGPQMRPVGDASTRNNWLTAAVLATLAADPDLTDLVEWGPRSDAGRDPLAVRVAKSVAKDIDDRRLVMPYEGRDPVSRPQWLSAAVRWALKQPPGVVAAQLVKVPQRRRRRPNQTALEVLTPRAS